MLTKSLFSVCIGSNFLPKFKNDGEKPVDACLLVFSANCKSSKLSFYSLWFLFRYGFVAVFIDLLDISVGFACGWCCGVFECRITKFCVNFTMNPFTNSLPLSVKRILGVPHSDVIFLWNYFSIVVASLFLIGIISTHLVNTITCSPNSLGLVWKNIAGHLLLTCLGFPMVCFQFAAFCACTIRLWLCLTFLFLFLLLERVR